MFSVSRTTTFILLVWMVWFVTGTAADQREPDVILPYVSDTTIVVVRVNLETLDLRAIESSVRRLMRLAISSEALPDGIDEIMMGLRTTAEDQVAQLRGAGVDEFAFLVHLARGDTPPISLVAPIGEGGDVDAVLEIANRLPGPFRGSARQIGRAVVCDLGALPASWPSARSDATRDLWARAFDASSDAPTIEVSALIPVAFKRAILELDPPLPKSAGGGSVTHLVEGFRWIQLEITASEDGFLGELKIQATDDEAATALWQRLIEIAVRAGQLGTIPREMQDAMVTLLQSVPPEVEAGRMTAELTPEHFDRVATRLAPSFAEARESAMDAQSMSQLRVLATGCTIYANQNDWTAFPPSLSVLVDEGIVAEEALIEPRSQQAYVYVCPDIEDVKTSPSDLLIIHEPFEAWPDRGVRAAFADGHVERIRSQMRFDAMKASSDPDPSP